MKRFENKVLLIQDEKILEEITEILFKKGFKIPVNFQMTAYLNGGFVYYSFEKEMFVTGDILDLKTYTELTYEEFINLLNAE